MAAAPAPLTCWAEGCAVPATSACARCRTAKNSGEPCQKAHRRTHKLRCKELEAAAAAEAAAAPAAPASPAAGGGGAGEGKPPRARRTPGVYSGLECRVQDYRCALGSCGATLEKGGTNTVCNGCRCVVYCNVECQTAHWGVHREGCYEAVRKRVKSGDVHQDDEGGEYVLRCWLGVCKDKHGDTGERTLACMSSLGALMQLQGKHAEAGALFRECLAARRAALGPKHKDTLSSMNSMAMLLQAQGNLAEAVPLMREALETARATQGPKSGSTPAYMSNLALMLKDVGKFSEAAPLLH